LRLVGRLLDSNVAVGLICLIRFVAFSLSTIFRRRGLVIRLARGSALAAATVTTAAAAAATTPRLIGFRSSLTTFGRKHFVTRRSLATFHLGIGREIRLGFVRHGQFVAHLFVGRNRRRVARG
jgi:hypothetical protein